MPQILDHTGVPLQSRESLAEGEYVGGVEIGTDVGWTNWTVQNAVRYGLKESIWVYRSIKLISELAVSVPFVVRKDGVVVESDLTEFLNSPSALMSSSDFYELLYQWMLLSGRAFILKLGKDLREIPTSWEPINPDRVVPETKEGFSNVIQHYKIGKKRIPLDKIVFLKSSDPSNVVGGLSPLQAAAKSVDTEVEQLKWNKSAMQNRGVNEGIISFDRDLRKAQILEMQEAYQEQQTGRTNARKMPFIGAAAKFLRTGMTVAELDWNESRKNLRDEILSAFGVPPQLVGAQESSTYNNFTTSERIFWQTTVIPFLANIASIFQYEFKGLLLPGEVIGFNYTEVEALRDNYQEKVNSGKDLVAMGVPMKQVNNILTLGIEEYEGWEESHPASLAGRTPTLSEERGNKTLEKEENSSFELRSFERRDLGEEHAQGEEHALSREGVFYRFFLRQLDSISEIVRSEIVSYEEAVHDTLEGYSEELEKILTEEYNLAANKFASKVVLEQRAESKVTQSIEEYFLREAVILNERYLIEKSTVKTVLDIIRDGYSSGDTVEAIVEELTDSGIFSEGRARTIARTVTGTGASVGQLVQAEMSGATIKIWRTALIEVRDLHITREGEEAPINGVFSRTMSPNGVFPRYPLDPNLDVSDRLNCRCTMTFR